MASLAFGLRIKSCTKMGYSHSSIHCRTSCGVDSGTAPRVVRIEGKEKRHSSYPLRPHFRDPRSARSIFQLYAT